MVKFSENGSNARNREKNAYFSFWTTSMFVRKVYKMVHLCKICLELALLYC